MPARKSSTPSDAPKIQTGKKGRVGWKGPSMVRYLNESRWERNAARRIRTHLRHHPNDLQAFRLAGIEGDAADFGPKAMRVLRGTARRLRREREGVRERYLRDLAPAGEA